MAYIKKGEIAPDDGKWVSMEDWIIIENILTKWKNAECN